MEPRSASTKKWRRLPWAFWIAKKAGSSQQLPCFHIIVAAGPVSRILSAGSLRAGRPFLWARHRCEALATYPEVVARRAGTRPAKLALRIGSLPIWSCSVWGLPCPLHYCSGGALLPHLFTLTPALPPRRYIFCGTFRQPGLNPASRTLSGTLLCGVRTFLPHHLTRQERPSGPAAHLIIICDVPND